MKRFKFFLALVIVWTASVAAYAELSHGDTFVKESDDGSEVWYRVSGSDKVTVRGGKENDQGEIAITATVTYGSQTFDVVELERGCFLNHRLLRKVTLPESITVIPVGAFNGTGVNDNSILTILEHVKTIERYAFQNCTDLTFLTIPEGVELIDEGAFKDCARLYSVDIPSTIKKIIGYPAVRPFAGCSGLTVATIRCPWLVGKDCRSASYDDHPIWCTFGNQVKDYYLKEPVTRIGQGAFRYCTNVIVVDCPPTLESIGVGAFDGMCMKLTKLKTTIEKWCEVDFDDDEWMGYPMLSAVTQFMVPGDDGEYVNVVNHIVIPEGITEVKQFAFRGFTYLQEVTIPSTVTSVGKMAFAGDVSLHKVTCLATTPPAIVADAFDEIPSDAILYVPTGCLDAYEDSYWKWCFGKITEAVQDDEVVTVGDWDYKILSVQDRRMEVAAYHGSASEVAVPEVLNYKNYDYTVVSIGNEAFKDNTTMTTLTLPCSIERIGSNAFSGCTGLTTLNYEMEFVPELGTNAFGISLKNNCTLYVFDASIAEGLNTAWSAYFKAIQGPSEPIYVDVSGLLYYDGQLEEETWSVPFLILPTGNKVQLGLGDSDVFEGKTWPQTFTVPETITYNGTTYTVTRIAANALATGIKEVTLPSCIEYIGAKAFSGVLETLYSGCVTLPATNSQTFAYLDENCKLYVPKGSVEAYSDWAQYFSSIEPNGGLGWVFTAKTEEGVDMKFKVTGKDEDGFYTVQTYGYSNGTRTYAAIPDNYQGAITIPDSVEYDGFTYVVTAIDEFSFDDDGNGIDLTEVTIPATVTSIGNWAFYSSNPTLTKVYCYAKVPPTIGSSVFNVNSNPKLYVTASAIAWDEDNSYRPAILNAYSEDASWNYYFYNNELREEMAFYVYVGEGLQVRFGITGKNTAMTCQPVDNFVDDGYEEVSAIIPATVIYQGKEYTVTEIGERSFVDYWPLTSITLPEGLESVGEGAFYDCTALETVTFSEGPTVIGPSAFSKCENLASITFAKGIKSIGSKAFENCTGLVSLTLPEGLESVGEEAFVGCAALETVTGNVAHIGATAFQNCTSLATVTFSEGLQSIDQYAFQGCTNLTSINLPESLTSIGMAAFLQCTGLTSIVLPENLTSIGLGAFFMCSSLRQVIRYAGDVPAVEIMEAEGQILTPFFGCSEDCALYVTYGTKDAYLADADWVQCFGERIYDKVPVTLSSYGIGTFSSNISLNFADVYGITPYVVTDFSGTTLTMKRQQEVPAGTGIVIYKGDGEDDFLFNGNEQEGQTDPNADQTFYVPVELFDAEVIANMPNNMLVGCPNATRIQPTDGDMTNFVLAKNPEDDTKLGFYKFTTTEAGRLIPAERAYLQIPTELANALGGIKGFSMNFDDENDDIHTGIESLIPSSIGEASLYNLAGQRLSKLQKGINIVNGKKVFVK